MPLSASPDWRRLHTGLTLAIAVGLVIVPLTLQVPEKLAAPAGRAEPANNVKAASADAK